MGTWDKNRTNFLSVVRAQVSDPKTREDLIALGSFLSGGDPKAGRYAVRGAWMVDSDVHGEVPADLAGQCQQAVKVRSSILEASAVDRWDYAPAISPPKEWVDSASSAAIGDLLSPVTGAEPSTVEKDIRSRRDEEYRRKAERLACLYYAWNRPAEMRKAIDANGCPGLNSARVYAALPGQRSEITVVGSTRTALQFYQFLKTESEDFEHGLPVYTPRSGDGKGFGWYLGWGLVLALVAGFGWYFAIHAGKSLGSKV